MHVSQDIPGFPFADYARMLAGEDDAPTIMRQAIKGKWQELVDR